ncbi:MAG TPA: HD domain-containing protein [Dehalococcoidia bacterium]|nr:HD domain-containing protein [Dehalococcoidia bacterium]
MASRPAAPALERFLEARTAEAVRASAGLGVEASRDLTDRLDEAICQLAEPVARDGLALVALGSYGRRELCRHSDVDIMLLVRGETSEAVNAVLYPLWDAGLKVGHSVRTPDQAIESARQNVETLTSLLDARLICGDARLYEGFLAARRRLVRAERARMRTDLAERRRALIEREPWQLQEPDVKTSRGGLRELHVIHWLTLADAIVEGAEAKPLGPDLAAAQETLLSARNALHALTDRPNDRFRLDLARPVAELLGLSRTECGRRLFNAMRLVDAGIEAALRSEVSAPRGLLKRVFTRRDDARPTTTSVEDDASDLDRLLAALRVPPAGLDPLPRAPWLERILPEWEVLRALPHVAPFHLHPVDVHAMRTVAEARRAAAEDTEETATTVAAEEFGNPDELLLAAALHDIGKGHEGDHSEVGAVIAERFAARVGLDADAAHRLMLAAQHHLLLPTVATRRDIADERVIREVADAIGDVPTLHLLYVIGVADARASGPDVWNPWKATLMRSLYLRVLDRLSQTGSEDVSVSELRRHATVEALQGQFGIDRVRHHLDQLPANYVLSASPETIGTHLELIERAAGGTALDHDREGDLDRLTIVTPDRPGILSLVAGTLAVHNVNVHGGSAYTRDDGVAIEVMYVSDGLGHGIDERRWARVRQDVPLALAGDFPLDERLAETRQAYRREPPAPIETAVHVDNVGSDRYSIVEVNAADRLGLLYAITHALHGMSLDIHLAKVDTVGHEVVDAFYVLRENGRRVAAPDEIARLQRRIIEAVAALDR